MADSKGYEVPGGLPAASGPGIAVSAAVEGQWIHPNDPGYTSLPQQCFVSLMALFARAPDLLIVPRSLPCLRPRRSGGDRAVL